MAETQQPDRANETPAPPKGRYVRQGWLVLVLALCFGAALAGVQVSLGPRIDANIRNDALSKVPDLVGVPRDRLDIRAEEVPVQAEGRTIPYQVYRAARKKDGTLAGWVVKAAGQGFADQIELLVALSGDGETIMGMSVLLQKETPGLGNKITAGEWEAQFAGIEAVTPVTVTKSAPDKSRGEIQAVTGATISSESVARIVNETVRRVGPKLAEMN